MARRQMRHTYNFIIYINITINNKIYFIGQCTFCTTPLQILHHSLHILHHRQPNGSALIAIGKIATLFKKI